jgi:hypothetical protein
MDGVVGSFGEQASVRDCRSLRLVSTAPRRTPPKPTTRAIKAAAVSTVASLRLGSETLGVQLVDALPG